VLTNVSFQILQGEFIGVIGPNGGGKTTLLKLLMGFLKPASGSLKIFGNNPADARHDIGYVPQRMPFDRLFPISVWEVVLTGRLAHLPWHGVYKAHDKELAHKALAAVELAPFADRAFGSLSGGQAQRVLIARALVSEPKLLLLDEPTSSVDVEAQAEIYDLLAKLRGTMTLAMVTHDLQAVIERVDRVLCVQGVVMPLKPEEVCQHFTMGLYHTPLIMPPRQQRTTP
jgi:zinc transport system ATP-binding protein